MFATPPTIVAATHQGKRPYQQDALTFTTELTELTKQLPPEAIANAMQNALQQVQREYDEVIEQLKKDPYSGEPIAFSTPDPHNPSATICYTWESLLREFVSIVKQSHNEDEKIRSIAHERFESLTANKQIKRLLAIASSGTTAITANVQTDTTNDTVTISWANAGDSLLFVLLYDPANPANAPTVQILNQRHGLSNDNRLTNSQLNMHSSVGDNLCETLDGDRYSHAIDTKSKTIELHGKKFIVGVASDGLDFLIDAIQALDGNPVTLEEAIIQTFQIKLKNPSADFLQEFANYLVGISARCDKSDNVSVCLTKQDNSCVAVFDGHSLSDNSAIPPGDRIWEHLEKHFCEEFEKQLKRELAAKLQQKRTAKLQQELKGLPQIIEQRKKRERQRQNIKFVDELIKLVNNCCSDNSVLLSPRNNTTPLKLWGDQLQLLKQYPDFATPAETIARLYCVTKGLCPNSLFETNETDFNNFAKSLIDTHPGTQIPTQVHVDTSVNGTKISVANHEHFFSDPSENPLTVLKACLANEQDREAIDRITTTTAKTSQSPLAKQSTPVQVQAPQSTQPGDEAKQQQRNPVYSLNMVRR